MNNSDIRSIYYCDFRAFDGSTICSNQPVRFAAEPAHFVVVGGAGFKKTWESGNCVVYVQVSFSDISFQVAING